MSKYIRFFGLHSPEPELPGLELVGGKGINLFKLADAAFPVPPGFVVTTDAYRRFTEANGLDDSIAETAASIDPQNMDDLGDKAGRIRAMFLDSPMPDDLAEAIRSGYQRLVETGEKRVAVRSSATAEDLPEASFAGQQDTYLNIGGEDAVIDAVKKCWSSLWTDRAVAYRAKHYSGGDGLAMGVVVQQMVSAEAAGVMFTANPLTNDVDEIVINATWGLGEALVGGHVTPDTIVVGKSTGDIKEIIVSEKTVVTAVTEHGTDQIELVGDQRTAQVLDDDAIEQLAEIGRRIELHYGHPQDIEWGLVGGKFTLLQSRPVQGMALVMETETGRQEEIERLRKLANGKHRVWVIHNLDETSAHPTPMTWDILKHFMSGAGGYGRMYRDFGFQPSETATREGFLELICGHIYCDPIRAAGMFWGQVPMQYKVDDILEDPTTIERPPNSLNVEDSDPGFFLKLPGWVVSLIRSGRRQKKARRVAKQQFDTVAVPGLMNYLEACRATDLSAMTTADLITELHRRRIYVLDEFGAESLKPGFFGGLAQGELLTQLAQLMGDAEAEKLGGTLTMGLEGDVTVEQNVVMYKVARGGATLDEFLDKFGHRATGEMELSMPRWREDREYVQQLIEPFKKAKKSPEKRHHEQTEARKKAEDALLDTLGKWGGSSLYERIRDSLKDAQDLLPYRETGKYYLMMGYETIRAALLEFGRRWGIGGDVFFLRLGELGMFENDSDAMLGQIARRKVRWESAKKLHVTDVIDTDHLEDLGQSIKATAVATSRPADAPAAAANELPARALAPGSAAGTARLVFDPRKAGDLGDSYVLVCPSTDPGWTPLFVNAAALVVERGGVLSHGAIVARDFGIPAVVCENATQLIKDKGRITVDGDRGVIVQHD